jgi:tripartite-type tricarboxylate transporter receptor subunit TctC
MSARHFVRAPIILAVALLIMLAAAAAPARAQSNDYPNRPVRIIVGFAAGGGNDVFARIVSDKLSQILGQSVVVENKPGAGSRLAAEYVTQQPADGYTLFIGPIGAMAIAAAVYPDLKYSPTKDFVPLVMIGHFPLILVVAADNPAKSVKELVAEAKQQPDKANYPSTSPAFTVAMEQFKLVAGMPGVMIPYKGSNEMILSVMNGQSMMSIIDPPPAVPQVKAGKVRALAVTGSAREALLPDVPTMKEAGFPGVNMQLWSGIFAPSATPPAVVAKLQKTLDETIRDPGVSDKLKALAVEPGGATPAEFSKTIASDIVKFRDVAKAANLKFEE